jgi:hypothetical protein
MKTVGHALGIFGYILGGLTLVVAMVAGAAKAFASDYVSEWTVTVTENGVERKLTQIDPQDIAYHFQVDQNLAPGWYCTVKPEVDFEGVRTRFLTCDYKGKTQAAIRTTCGDTAGRRAQEVWLGESYKVAVKLECRSGELP